MLNRRKRCKLYRMTLDSLCDKYMRIGFGAICAAKKMLRESTRALRIMEVIMETRTEYEKMILKEYNQMTIIGRRSYAFDV